MKELLRNTFRLIFSLLWGGLASLPALVGFSQSIDFAADIRPILSEKCFRCHGPDAATRQAELRLDEADSAARVTRAEGTAQAAMLKRITAADPADRMPPLDAPHQLTTAEVAMLQRWLERGAPFQTHWAFIPPQRPPLPTAASDVWCVTPIDAFTLEQLQRERLAPAPPAEPARLARRVALDLTGLPLTSEELVEFLAVVERLGIDTAYAQLVDRLLSRPRHGEHMALPWLEAARYADTDGYQNDRYRYQDAWRDWVIRAFNENLSYDQFVIEQMAGDLLPSATLWQQVATGFGRNHRINSEDGSIAEEWLVENIVDRVDTLGTVFLGLTIGCSRCHDHKYDPLSQQDYYQLFAYFNGIAEHGVGPNNGNSPPFIELPKSWPLISEAENHAIDPEPVKLHPARKEEGNGLMRPQAGEPGTVMVMHELPEPRETYLLVRGEYNVPDKSQRLFPNVPAALRGSVDAPPPRDRLGLARWLVDRQNPLTARVAINRLWQHLFGTGLVASSDNFGSQGTPPSHPQLLDWLAVELMDGGWDLRRLQRQIVLSATYRQASATTGELLQRDPANRLLARGPRQRLSGFVLRDQALAVSGLLVEKLGGPSVKPYMPADIWSSISNNTYQQDSGANLFRRSLYTYWRRTIPPPTMMSFNAASREVCTVRTDMTNTPLQALTLMNNIAFVEAAKKLAERMLLGSLQPREEPDETQQGTTVKQIVSGFVLCTARNPSEQELALLLRAHAAFLHAFEKDVTAAEHLLALGEAPYDPSLKPVPLAAMTMTASLLLNLDETITKE